MAASHPSNVSATSRVAVFAASTPGDWQAASRLVGELVDWLRDVVSLDARASQHDSLQELASLPAFYSAPSGRMLLGALAGHHVGTTGVKLMEAGTAELRRVWVTPAARGNLVAPPLLSAGIEAARELGARRILLETAAGHMDKAIAMYTRAGFRPIPHYTSLHEVVPGLVSLGLDLG